VQFATEAGKLADEVDNKQEMLESKLLRQVRLNSDKKRQLRGRTSSKQLCTEQMR
jgi:hypothetical protein